MGSGIFKPIIISHAVLCKKGKNNQLITILLSLNMFSGIFSCFSMKYLGVNQDFTLDCLFNKTVSYHLGTNCIIQINSCKPVELHSSLEIGSGITL